MESGLTKTIRINSKLTNILAITLATIIDFIKLGIL